MAMWSRVLAVSLVVMGLSHTVARERICAPLRDRLGGKETWLGYLVSCPYCVSHWVAFVLVPLTGACAIPVAPRWGIVSRVAQWFLSSVLVAVIAAFFRVAFYFVDESQGLVKRRQRSVEEEVESTRVLRERVQEGEKAWNSRAGERGAPRAAALPGPEGGDGSVDQPGRPPH
jgi:uncharacterized membrane protein